MIDPVIKRSLGQIEYCYEKGLLVDRALAGTVIASFVITPAGAVQGATATGLPAIDTCVAAAITRIEFPAAPDGGTARVNYPFTFRPVGED